MVVMVVLRVLQIILVRRGRGLEVVDRQCLEEC